MAAKKIKMAAKKRTPLPIPVTLAAYDSDWPRRAAVYAERLKILGPALVEVHHIGSTSVPGLAAKPIIDLMPLVTSLAALDAAQPQIEALGYLWYGEFGIPRRRYCSLTDAQGTRLAQLHFFAEGDPQSERHLAFRDYLRAHPAIARAYETEKQRARDRHPDDSHAYTDEKAAWIQATEAEALLWYCHQR